MTDIATIAATTIPITHAQLKVFAGLTGVVEGDTGRSGVTVVVGVRIGVSDGGASASDVGETMADVVCIGVGVGDGTGEGDGIGVANGANAVNSVKWLTGTVIVCLIVSTTPSWIVTHWPAAVS